MDALRGALPAPAPGGLPAGDWATLQASCAAFLLIWLAAQATFRALRWHVDNWNAFGNAVSCGMSLFHGVSTAVLSGREVVTLWRAPMDAPNTPQQNFIMQLSMGYFLLDSVHVVAYQLDPLYLLHHVQTLTYMAWSSLLGRGSMSVMWLMFSGEITSPLQNTWMLSKYGADRRYPRCTAAQAWLSPLFTAAFTLMRLLVGPPVAWLVVRGVRGSDVLPRSAQNAWSVIAVVGVVGSWAWVRKLLKGAAKARAKARQAAAAKRA